MLNFLRLVVLCVVLLVIAGCAVIGGTGGDSGSLVYTGPTEQSVEMGAGIPGSDIRYVGYSERGIEVLIDDQRAIKKVGDSLDWHGSPVAGTDVSMAQRILFANESRLQTVGTVKVTVRNPRPEVALFPGGQTPYTYKVAVTHTVRRGDAIPGTLITYKGKAEEGAEFEGLSGYPYRKMGDSVIWTGRLGNGVYLDSTYRVVAYTEDFVTLAAIATVALGQ
jgi:hypothetical protein